MSHLITCPECKKNLQVPDELIGKKVQCPECKHTFTAQVETEEVSVSSKPSKAPPPSVPATSKPPAWDTKKGAADDDDDDRYDVKKKRRRRDEDDEEEDDDRPSRRRGRRRRSGRDYVPHRGGLILAFGIIALVSGLGIIFGPIAWIMGNSDLREIQNGTMDPEGEGMTQTGRILGMIATILSIVGIVAGVGIFVLYFGCVCCVIFGAAANNPNNMNRPRRF
jgi:predicted Zn finger-like uncharacterized protein